MKLLGIFFKQYSFQINKVAMNDCIEKYVLLFASSLRSKLGLLQAIYSLAFLNWKTSSLTFGRIRTHDLLITTRALDHSATTAAQEWIT